MDYDQKNPENKQKTNKKPPNPPKQQQQKPHKKPNKTNLPNKQTETEQNKQNKQKTHHHYHQKPNPNLTRTVQANNWCCTPWSAYSCGDCVLPCILSYRIRNLTWAKVKYSSWTIVFESYVPSCYLLLGITMK